MRRTKTWIALAGGLVFLGLSVAVLWNVRPGAFRHLAGLTRGAGSDSLPDQRQDSARIAEIAALRLQREGMVTVAAAGGSGEGSGRDSIRVRWVVQAPQDSVRDADLRGYLDGSVRYQFNQGTSYHLRVGRRWESPRAGRFELKRSLIRFPLPAMPPGATVEAARVGLWTEAFYFGAPLAGEMASLLPLHLYAYPVDPVWSAGSGGIARDDFSEPAEGEVSWLDARAGEVEWPSPGVLDPPPDGGSGYGRAPVATARVEGEDRPLVLEGARLTAFVEERRPVGAADLLLKLEDREEDRPGTEMAFLSSEFGDPNDLAPRRPRLEIEARLPCPCTALERPFVLEPGAGVDLPPLRMPAGGGLIGVEITPEPAAAPPEVFIRGWAAGGDSTEARWAPYRNPFPTRWAWVQVRLSATVNRMAWGDTLEVVLKETWVRPGPRHEQVPDLVLISPSGRTVRVPGRPADSLRYRLRHELDEVGLWRYGWSFRPTVQRRPGSHGGEGLAWVDLPADDRGMDRFLGRLGAMADSLGSGHPLVQANLNAASRWVGRAPGGLREARRARLEAVLGAG